MRLLRIKPAVLLLNVVLLVMFLLSGGCGKKAPPVAPRQPAMTAVTDLAARYRGGQVVLTWQHLPTGAAVTGYAIYRFRQARVTSDCPGCPLLFEKVQTVDLDPSAYATRHVLTWSQDVSLGYRYTYKVVPVQSSGSQGPDSNLAMVELFQQ